MRLIRSPVALVALALLAPGCSKNEPGRVEIGSGPKLVVVFPEKTTIDTMGTGQSKVHNAMWTQKRPDGVLILGAMVTEMPAGDGKTTPEEILEAAAGAFKQFETSRTPFTAGKKKYPGLEIVSKMDLGKTGGPMFKHEKIVIAGHNMYTATATGTQEGYLQDKEVRKFLESFRIEE